MRALSTAGARRRGDRSRWRRLARRPAAPRKGHDRRRRAADARAARRADGLRRGTPTGRGATRRRRDRDQQGAHEPASLRDRQARPASATVPQPWTPRAALQWLLLGPGRGDQAAVSSSGCTRHGREQLRSACPPHCAASPGCGRELRPPLAPASALALKPSFDVVGPLAQIVEQSAAAASERPSMARADMPAPLSAEGPDATAAPDRARPSRRAAARAKRL